MPRVERGEFLNVGAIVYCSAQRFLKILFHLDQQRLFALSPEIDMVELEERLKAFEYVCAGSAKGGPIGALPLASRFRWLTATRSTIVQTSAVHPGLCIDAAEALNKLYSKMVL